ncbi:glutathione S-transferase [Pseudooceanicola antarcticus]|uniref:Glutathione S-transferase n=1 Tax=Pseudooceanicola antarcticus TaxID=1247613 RepID=A0A285J835_9RHOB|nr:glutathione S-transferase family protein [Pseudooceanicola antarcticus]PJE27030.1 glutathione S-transferase family protein [Pseudooceanicola antarcticus]SNY56213.1 glutathione S-transferase [Pseudooceanicola antarcticus]
MLTLYYSPMSRASRIIRLIDELDIWSEIEIRRVSVARLDGAGGQDPSNPHPDGKVPLLVHDGVEIWESNAIILYLTDLFPKAGMGPVAGDPLRGRYLSWLAWYGNVVEPVIVMGAAELSHPILTATFRGQAEMTERLVRALEGSPFLMGEQFTAADLLMVSPFTWAPASTPDHPLVRAWIERCDARPSAERTARYDAEQLQEAGVA